MKNKDFENIDKLAKDAFEQFEVEFDPMDWVDLQSKLRSESSIDQVAKDALKDYEVSFDEQDWKRLERHLDKKKDLFPHIWWFKSAEVSLMALLLFTIFNISPNKNKLNQSNHNYDSTTTLTPSSSSTKEPAQEEQNNRLFQIDEKERAAAQQDESNTIQAQANHVHHDIMPLAMATNRQGASKHNLNSSTTEQQVSSTHTSVNKDINNSEMPNQPQTNGAGEDGIVATPKTLKTDDANHSSTLFSNDLTRIENKTANKSVSTKELEAKPSLFSILEIPTLETPQEIQTTDPIFELKKVKQNLPYDCKTYLGGIAVVGANFATSMGGTSIGYGAGLLMDTELSSRIALKTGFIVSYKKYELDEIILLDKMATEGKFYTIEQHKTTNLVLLEIPLDIQYTFFKNEKWRIYATAGLSLNVIGSRTYDGFQKTTDQGFSISTKINSDNYERGAFEGSAFNQNVFLSAGGGLGLERQLGDKVSLYILPSYRHALTSSGINKDKIHSFAVNIGIKTAL